MNVPYNIPYISGKEKNYLDDLLIRNQYCGDGFFTKEVTASLQKITNASKVLLTTSCTHALEMAAILLDIKSGDEVIMPSFTFVSSANPFILCGAKIVFVDILPADMNIDVSKIEAAITKKTKAIVCMHYAGVACDMEKLMQIADAHNLFVVEDAAQCFDAFYNGKHLGTVGHLGTISFHETKNIHCGEGGALLINDPRFIERAEIIREKGTNRSNFLRGVVDKYTWVDKGSSYLPSELNAAFLLGQLTTYKEVKEWRKQVWTKYYDGLTTLQHEGLLALPEEALTHDHNAHIFFVKPKAKDIRDKLIVSLKKDGIQSVFHYIPLHSSDFGKKNSTFSGDDVYTTIESERLVRLPLYYGMSLEQVAYVLDKITAFFA